ncbi:MAG: phosphoglycerate dehydrogenase [Alphaproteobacteria bacterium]
MAKVLISDKMSSRAAEIFKARGIEVDVDTGLDPDQLVARIGAYDGLVLRSASKVTPAVLDAATNLKVVGRAGIGVDNIDVPAATARGVVVMNTPFGNSITTAEHAIALMMALARRIPAADHSTQAGKWEKSRFMGVELTGKTLGIIGCGNIGSIVADRALGLRMKVLAYDPYLSSDRAEDIGVEKVDLDDLLARSDIVTLHVPLSDTTRNIIDAAAIAKMREGARLINCARGGLVVEADVKAALDSGHLAGAAFDVFAVEPAKENPLFCMEQFIATPHLGAATEEAQENVAVQVSEQISDFLLTGTVVNAINMPSVSAEDAPRLKPYMTLAEQLGGFAGQITESGLEEVCIEYEGVVASLNTRPLTALVLRGLLAPLMENVNMVNAPVLARDRNIKVSEVKNEQAGDYQTLIRLIVTTERGSRTIAGTLFGGHRPRLVLIEDVAVEAELGPHMLFVRNDDEPGFIGRLGMTVAEAGVNIATFHLGRTAPGGDAIALIQVDEPVTAELLEAVRAVPSVNQAKSLHF